VLHGRPAEALLRCADEEGAELLVVGMTGRGTVNELLMGSTTHRLLQHTARPIVAVPAGWAPDGSA
jgi:nucleotide-binding universal stress UspA family protein